MEAYQNFILTLIFMGMLFLIAFLIKNTEAKYKNTDAINENTRIRREKFELEQDDIINNCILQVGTLEKNVNNLERKLEDYEK